MFRLLQTPHRKHFFNHVRLREKSQHHEFPTQYSQFLLKIFYINFSFIYTPYLEMQSSKLEMGYNENNETNLCQISTVCVSSVFVPNVTCMMDVRTMLARAGPSATAVTAATIWTTAGPDSSSKAESVFIRNRRVEKWASGRWFTS